MLPFEPFQKSIVKVNIQCQILSPMHLLPPPLILLPRFPPLLLCHPMTRRITIIIHLIIVHLGSLCEFLIIFQQFLLVFQRLLGGFSVQGWILYEVAAEEAVAISFVCACDTTAVEAVGEAWVDGGVASTLDTRFGWCLLFCGCCRGWLVVG